MLRSPARQRRTASALKAGENVRRGRFFLTVFPCLSMEHSWRASAPIGVSTKSKQAQTTITPISNVLRGITLVLSVWWTLSQAPPSLQFNELEIELRKSLAGTGSFQPDSLGETVRRRATKLVVRKVSCISS